MWQKLKYFIPEGRTNILYLFLLVLVLLFIMPNLIGWGAVSLVGSSRIWIALWLIILQIMWALIWYLVYWGLRDYIIKLLLVRNLLMGLYFITGIFTATAVINGEPLFTVFMIVLSYISMIIWYSYVFNNQKDSDQAIRKSYHFWQIHRHVNQDDVEKMIEKNNEKLLMKIKEYDRKSNDFDKKFDDKI